MVNSIIQFMREEEGATGMEYGLLAALIAAAMIIAVTEVGTSIINTFQTLSNAMSAGSS